MFTPLLLVSMRASAVTTSPTCNAEELRPESVQALAVTVVVPRDVVMPLRVRKT